MSVDDPRSEGNRLRRGSGESGLADHAVEADRVRPAVIGPILQDELDDGNRKPVGSAFRVVRHLRAMGLAPLLVTRVGDDELGRRLIEMLGEIDADSDGVQIDPDRPTSGPTDGSEEPVAWDGLDPDAAARAMDRAAPPLAFQTTTAPHSEGAQSALRAIRNATGVPFFVDVDLDRPWMHPDTLGPVLLGARWLRVQAEQLAGLAIDAPALDAEPEIAAAHALRQSFALDRVVVEEHGIPVTIVSSRRVSRGRRPPRELELCSPAIRDAAAAGLTVGLARGWSERALLARTVKLIRLLTEADPQELTDLKSRKGEATQRCIDARTAAKSSRREFRRSSR